MGSEGSHTAIGITIQMGKLEAVLFGHRLNLKCQNAQIIQNRRHTIRQHPQVLRTAEHPRLAKDLRQTTSGLTSPEEVVTLVEEIVIKTHEGIFLLIGQGIEYRLVIDTDARMVHIRLSRIFQEQHATNQAIKAITNPETVLISTTFEVIAHLTLRIVFRFQIVKAVTAGNQEVLFHKLGMNTEKTLYHTVIDKRTRHKIFSERQSEVFYLTDRQRKCW